MADTRDHSPGFEPIEQLRAHEYVAEQLRRQIGLHIVPVGGALPSERELSSMFGVGRATVQAAIRLLEAERLVETRRGRHGGTFVTGHSTDDVAKDYLLVRLRRDTARITEALAFRRNADTFAASLAARERTADDLRMICSANERTLAAGSDAEFMAHDTEFHLAVARAAHNAFVYDAVERMRLVLNDAMAALPESKLWQRRTGKEHAAIVAAIEKRAADAAAKAMERHAASTEKSIKALLAAL
jgi:GntR family transcriptional repressor for pyruvate dehydrogenase complex